MNKDNQYGYPQDQGGYPPGYGQQQGYPQQGYPSPQGYPQQGYPQQSGYPPQQGYAQNDHNSGYTASPQQYPPQPSHASPNYDQPIQQLIPSNNEKFKPAPRFNDIWAAILYFIVLAGFIVSAVMYVRGFNIRNISNEEVFGNKLDIYLYPILAGGIASLIFSAIYLFLMQTFPGFLIRVSFWFSAAMYFVTAVLFFKAGGTMNIVFAVLSIIGGIIYIFLWFSWRHKIPFATLMLKNVSKFVTNYWGTIISTICFLIVSFGFYVIWVITAGAVLSASSDQQTCTTDRTGRQRCSLPAKYYVFYVYLVFVLFWTTQLIRDLSHMTVSGAFGSHYFFPNGGKFTTLASAGRALSTSFGSGCFGSLIIAVIRTLRFLASQLRQSDNGWLAILGCCLECFIGMIEGLVDYFNTYAYTYCAMYGKAYLDAGKATWNLIKDRGVEAIINDNLVGNVLGMGGFLIAGIGALVGFLFITIKGSTGSNPANQKLEVVITVVLINFLVGNVLFGIISSIVDSANVSFFVCLAEDPQALAATNPELFEKIRQTYPEVVQSV